MTTPSPDAIALGAIRSLSAVTVAGVPKSAAQMRADLMAIEALAIAANDAATPLLTPPPVPPVTPPAPTPNPAPPGNPVGVPPTQPPASGSGALLVLEDFEHPSEAAFRASLPQLGARHPELLSLDPSVPYQGRASLRYEQPAGTKASPEIHIRFSAPQSDVWLGTAVRFSPGWTTRGTKAATANSYKLMGFHWANKRTPAGKYVTGRSTVEITNYTQYLFGGEYKPGVPIQRAVVGRITDEWTGVYWYVYRCHYRRVDDTTALLRHWRYKNGAAPQLIATVTLRTDPRYPWATVPYVSGVFVGLNFNQIRAMAQSLNVALIEVWADGNPWSL